MISDKNILIVSKSAQPGGLEYHVLDLVKGFTGANRLYVMVPPGPLIEDYEKAGAKVINIYPTSSLDISFIKKVKKFCEEKKIHIVHTHELTPSQALISAFLAKVKKRIYHVHTPFLKWSYKNIQTKILKTIPNWIFNFITANFIATDVISLTPGIKKYRTMYELVFPYKNRVIPNAFDFEKYSYPISTKQIIDFKSTKKIPLKKTIIGNISRLTKEKGHIYLLEAFKTLYNTNPDKFFLLLAGGGELENEYINYCNKNFPNNYIITGRFKEEDKLKYLHSIDFFVFPSLAEGFGYVPLEAMAAKRPLIVSNLEVLRYVTKDTVFFFEKANYKDLYTNLTKVINNPKEVEESLKKAYKQAQMYSFDAFVKNYSSIYNIN